MKKEHTEFYEKVVDNLRKIMVDRHITQVAMGDYMDTSESGVAINLVQQQADHSSVAMTAIYVGKSPAANAELRNANILPGKKR